MKNIKYYIALPITLLALLFSCSEDLGNYNYTNVNEVVFNGLDNEYSTSFGEKFELTPELSFTKDATANTDDYEYEWIAISQNTQLRPFERDYNLGNTKHLLLDPVTLPSSLYSIHFRVTDKNTGIQWNTQFYLDVVSSIYEGFLVLCDDNGTARLDMVSLIDGQYKAIPDILAYSNSPLQLKGAPKFVFCYKQDYGKFGIYVSTEGNGTTRIDPETFDWKTEYYLSFEALIPNIPTDYGVDYMNISSFREYTSFIYDNGNIYYYIKNLNIRYSVPINIVASEKETFKAAPFIAACPWLNNIIYDADNKRFLKHTYNQQSCTELPEGTRFNYHTGKDLVYMDQTTFNQGEVFAVLHDPTDSKLYLARIGVPFFGDITQNYYDEIPAEVANDMLQAGNFAISRDFGYLLYNLGSKVYEYDFNLKQSKVVLDKGTDEITLIKFENNYIAEDWASKLQVYTYNETTKVGTLEIYNVPPVNGDLELQGAYPGIGKAVSAAYRVR